jgi:hypothetical protein
LTDRPGAVHAAARLGQPIFIHPQIPSNPLCDAAYRAWIRLA